MENVFKGSSWIWSKDEFINQYVSFTDYFEYDGAKDKTLLNISVDTQYVVWINGCFAAFGQYADFPYYKVYDSVDISKYIVKGKNTISVLVYYCGEDNSTYFKSNAGLIFKVSCGGKILLSSSENTLCRIAPEYRQGAVEKITMQLGYTYHYDNCAYDGWNTPGYIAGKDFKTSQIVNKGSNFYIRPIKKLLLSDSFQGTVCAQGVYKKPDTAAQTAAQFMQNSYLKTLTPYEMTGKPRINVPCSEGVKYSACGGDGLFLIIDLYAESAGYLTFEIETEKECMLYVGFGEHLTDLRVRSRIEERNFAVSYKLKKGLNYCSEYLRRFGCRYLQMFLEAESFTLYNMNLNKCEYPVQSLKFELSDSLHQKIFETGKNTLKLCMHEHYEDCPWREQALYAMDSRNQMLFGYYTLGEYDFPKASLRLLALSQQEEGLLSLCAPAVVPITIPVFSLFWILALKEYIEISSDMEFFKEMQPCLEKLNKLFISRMENNLQPCFKEIKYWNFYEWSDGLDGELERNYEIEKTFDAPLNAVFVMALKACVYLYGRAGDAAKAEYFKQLKDKTAASILKTFYNEKEGMFYTFSRNGKLYGTHELTQCHMLYLNEFNEKINSKLEKVIKDSNNGLVKITLSNFCFKYIGLIEYDFKNIDFVIKDIEKVFGFMLFKGATSFWETEKGEADFNDAGSLCHAWSSVPCYIYYKYIAGVNFDDGLNVNFSPLKSRLSALKAEFKINGRIYKSIL